jgi:hypothetical protein
MTTPADDERYYNHVPTDKEAAEARWLLSLPDDERRGLMDLADARESGLIES